MNLSKATSRDRKRTKRKKHGRDGDSVKEIQRLQIKRRDAIINKRRKEKEELRDEK